MRPLFAIAPLALAFVLLGPTEVTSISASSLIANVWHKVFDRDVAPAQGTPSGQLNNASAVVH